ncbi:LRR receptor-like serine/threonine-protein kinase RCH1 [Hibiscus syriacus]|uniref:non-specific serine/threonine protein kinase n=1 Tax=Hibiscus syriacus TaxID=106335 RepID=A0A6A2XK16_HIBSY|nr:LRR receptor-like serine/threonine-protein kinase RCH1 [Hibiscus syriacus]
MPMPMPRQSKNHKNQAMPRLCLALLLLPLLLFPYDVCAANSEAAALLIWLHSSPSPPPALSNCDSSDPNPCRWSYIICSSQNSVVEINIQFVELALPFPSNLSSLPFLQKLVISGANLTGTIPLNIGDCSRLTVIDVSANNLVGNIPASIGKLRYLQDLILYSNQLTGEIPAALGECISLKKLLIFNNYLSGNLPVELGKLSNIEVIRAGGEPGHCWKNPGRDWRLQEPKESFGNLSKLQELMLSNNNITGTIPPVLSNATGLLQLQLDTNQISGSIPAELGTLTKLTVFFAWQNKLEGSIPAALAGCGSLTALDLSHNALTGSLPPGLFQLQNLTKLLLISNGISGTIPPEIGNCSSLIRVRLVNNRISGMIPKEVGFLDNLIFLDLSGNHLSGSVPNEIGNCSQMQMLNLSNNTVEGPLPGSLSSLTRLQVLDVSVNQFTRQIPQSLGQLTSLNRLILSTNFLSGAIPSSLGHCLNLQLLDLSSNAISGTIAEELFNIQALDIALNLSWNALSGVIPPQISALNKLSILDLSHNKLEGDLLALSELENLVSLNISYNNFTGYLPDSKFSATATGMQSDNGFKRSLKITIAVLITLAIALAFFGALAVFRARKMMGDDNDSEVGADSWPWQFTPFQKLNFSVDQVLKCLVEGNVIGKGCSGIVYRVELDNGETIAVKKLWPTTMAAGYDCHSDKAGVGGVRDSFSAEVKTLGSIRHKNIVKFLGCCWNRSTRLLLYDYMENGSLGSLLHEHSGSCLEWDLRYRIILGAAQGLAYLHHDCVPPIVHRDIKANNILIGLQFESYIADFGLAKLVDNGDFVRSSSTVAGSYGYIAPEYGYMKKITEKSDVYSYGVVVLEVLTGKQPIDPTIPYGLHIVDWVRQKRGGIEVLDPRLQPRQESEIDEMLQTIGVALLCVNPSPDDRPTMKDVAAMLKEIKQEREECTKVDMVRNGSSDSESNQRGNSKSPPSMIQNSYPQSSSTSFSASSLLYSSTSNAKLAFK